MADILTMEQAENLRDRTLAAIDAEGEPASYGSRYGAILVADRERIISDFAGLRWCWARAPFGPAESRYSEPATLFSDGLIRTAAPYGEKP